jgi:hypothetical protein
MIDTSTLVHSMASPQVSYYQEINCMDFSCVEFFHEYSFLLVSLLQILIGQEKWKQLVIQKLQAQKNGKILGFYATHITFRKWKLLWHELEIKRLYFMIPLL